LSEMVAGGSSWVASAVMGVDMSRRTLVQLGLALCPISQRLRVAAGEQDAVFSRAANDSVKGKPLRG